MFRAHFFDTVDDRSSIIVAIGDSHSVHGQQTFLLLERNASDQKLLSAWGSIKLFRSYVSLTVMNLPRFRNSENAVAQGAQPGPHFQNGRGFRDAAGAPAMAAIDSRAC
jgi:hypothetical protein